MNNQISICIPTYNRPALLREALDSCFLQTYPEFEVVIGDDSPSNDTLAIVEAYQSRFPGRVFYKHNIPSLGQAGNVNDLFRRAKGDRLLLLHDDDMLLPGALEILAARWIEIPYLTAAFGKQYITDHVGNVSIPKSEELNRRYGRTPDKAGLLEVPAIAGVSRMFPNNGYLICTAIAREIGYRPPAEVGHACDTDFGVRLCTSASAICFVDEYVAKYRVSDDALTINGRLEAHAYRAIQEAVVPLAAIPAQKRALRDLAPAAVSAFARLGKPRSALEIFLSAHYGLSRRLHPRAAFHILLVIRSYLKF